MEELEQKVARYQPSPQSQELVKQTSILFLVGPTGSGKDSVKHGLLDKGGYHHIVSHTTRKPRINRGVLEQDGREYHFIDVPTAIKMLDEQAFIEAKLFSTNLYGTSVAEIQKAHDDQKIAVTDLEVQGVAVYKAFDPNVKAVFVLPPGFAVWQDRIRKRYGDNVDPADFKRRMQIALTELDQLFNSDYYIPVINDNLPDAVEVINQLAHDQDAHTATDEALKLAKQLYEDIKANLQYGLGT